MSQQQIGPPPLRRSSCIAAAQSPSTQPKTHKRLLQSTQTSTSPSKIDLLTAALTVSHWCFTEYKKSQDSQAGSFSKVNSREIQSNCTLKSTAKQVTLKKETTTSIMTTRYCPNVCKKTREATVSAHNYVYFADLVVVVFYLARTCIIIMYTILSEVLAA